MNLSKLTLQDVINSHAQYLIGSPTTYTPWLQSELERLLKIYLAESFDDYLKILAKGDGNVGIIKSGLNTAFQSAVQRVMSNKITQKYKLEKRQRKLM